MWKQDTLPSGINDDTLRSSINDQDLEDNLDQDDEDLDDDQDQDDDDQDEDQDDQDQGKDNQDKPKQSVDYKKKFYQTTNLQNKMIGDLKKEIDQLKNSKSLSDDDLKKIREKYDEEDLDIIEKIIERKATDLMDKRQQSSLAQREMNILVKEHPELTEPELKHIRSLQKEYWYSLKKAYTMLFWKFETKDNPKPRHSVSNSFGGDSWKESSKSNTSKEDEKAFKDMEAFL